MSEIKNNETIVESKSILDQIKDEPVIKPLVAVHEDENNYFLSANLPGVKKENIQLKIEDNSLIIAGKIDTAENENRKCLFAEMPIANYYRRFNLAEKIDSTKIEASNDNGVLLVKLPKIESVKPRIISIN